jgi:hypothetical protein
MLAARPSGDNAEDGLSNLSWGSSRNNNDFASLLEPLDQLSAGTKDESEAG